MRIPFRLAVVASLLVAGCTPSVTNAPTQGAAGAAITSATVAAGTGAAVAPAPEAAPVRAGCQVTRLIRGNLAEAVQLCPNGTTLTGFQSNDSLANYYGYVTATTLTSTTDVNMKRALGDFLWGLFGTSEFTAQISVAMEIQTASGVTPLPERPLLIIQRKRNGDVDVQAESGVMQNARVTPAFALDAGDPAVNVRFRVRRTDSVNVSAVNIAQAGAEVASSLGAEGWLISGLSDAVLFNALTKGQSYVSEYFSDDISISTSSRLSFGRPNGLTSVIFETGWGRNAPSAFKLELKLNVVQSQITDRTRTAAPGLIRPDLISAQHAPAGGTWANRIVVIPSSTAGPAKRLGAVLAESGVPRRLAELNTAGMQQFTGAQRVEAACRDLVDALISDQYFRLNELDANLVLYDQLNQAGVFTQYSPSQIPCVQSRVNLWRTQFGIVLPEQVADISIDAMEGRLLALSRHWRGSSSELRAGITDSFISPVTVVVPLELFPAVRDALFPEGSVLGRGQINAAALAEARLTCLGAWRKDGKVAANMFAHFADVEGPFVVRVTFQEKPGTGSLIDTLSIRRMTDAEKAAALEGDPATSCVA